MELRGDFDELSLDNQVRSVMSAWESSMPRLLVFDNCEDEGLLREWMPAAGGSRVLVASQKSNWSPSSGLTTVRVDIFERSVSLQLLHEHLRDRHSTAGQTSTPALGHICDVLGDFPLAIDLAGRFLRYYGQTIGPGEYLEELRAEQLAHDSLNSQDESPTEHVMNVRLTFELSYKRLESENRGDRRGLRLRGQHPGKRKKVNKLAKDILARLRFLAPGQSVSLALLQTTLGWSNPDTKRRQRMTEAVTKLVDLGLLSQNEKSEELWIHGLVSQAIGEMPARRSKTSAAVKKRVEDALISRFTELLNENSPRRLIALIPHLQVASENAARRGDKREHSLCAGLGYALFQNREYGKARVAWERTLEISQGLWGDNNLTTLQDFENVGTVTKRENDYDASLQIYAQVLSIHQKNPRYDLVVKDPSMATEEEARTFSSVHLNIGAALREKAVSRREPQDWDLDTLKEVYPHYERALHIRDKGLGFHSDTAESIGNMGFLMIDMKAAGIN